MIIDYICAVCELASVPLIKSFGEFRPFFHFVPWLNHITCLVPDSCSIMHVSIVHCLTPITYYFTGIFHPTTESQTHQYFAPVLWLKVRPSGPATARQYLPSNIEQQKTNFRSQIYCCSWTIYQPVMAAAARTKQKIPVRPLGILIEFCQWNERIKLGGVQPMVWGDKNNLLETFESNEEKQLLDWKAKIVWEGRRLVYLWLDCMLPEAIGFVTRSMRVHASQPWSDWLGILYAFFFSKVTKPRSMRSMMMPPLDVTFVDSLWTLSFTLTGRKTWLFSLNKCVCIYLYNMTWNR